MTTMTHWAKKVAVQVLITLGELQLVSTLEAGLRCG